MSTKIETTIGELPRALSNFPDDRRVCVVVEDSDAEKVNAINTMLKDSRASAAVDGEKALGEIRADLIALADTRAAS
jgi:hypothetical protein